MGKGDGKGKGGDSFDEATLEVYKECFRLMDIDKDGVIQGARHKGPRRRCASGGLPTIGTHTARKGNKAKVDPKKT